MHNTALYEGVGLLVLVAVLAALSTGDRRPGTLLGVFALWYGTQPFSTDFLRAYDRCFLGLTAAQYASVVLAAYGLWILRRRRKSPLPAEASQ